MKLDDAYVAGKKLAEVFGDPEVAYEAGKHFTCREADGVAEALRLLDQPDAATAWIKGHADSDEPDDAHHGQGGTP